jgi:hypothetical protein
MTMTTNEAANVQSWRQVREELELEIDDATQWATIYRLGRPVATAQRRRVLEKNAPDWQVFALDGRLMFSLFYGGRDPAARIVKRLAAYLVDHGPPAIARISELVQRKRELLALRDLRDGAERQDVQDDIDAITAELEQLANA